jgi:hypothetical protein
MPVRMITLGVAIGALSASAPLLADDLRGANTFLCAAAEALLCTADGNCASEPARKSTRLTFVEIDLASKSWGATVASGQKWGMDITTIDRNGDTLLLQGNHESAAFSFVIDEPSGTGSYSMTSYNPIEGPQVLVAFGFCTPIPLRKQ